MRPHLPSPALFFVLSTLPIIKGSDTNAKAERVLLEDVHDAVGDLVELIKTYKNKNTFAQVLMSSLFKQRQEEAEAVVDSAISLLQVSTLPCYASIIVLWLKSSMGCGQ